VKRDNSKTTDVVRHSPPGATQSRGRMGNLLRRIRIALRFNRLGVVGLFLILCLILVAIFAPLIAPYDPSKLNIQERLQPPSIRHLFGTDAAGRDIFSRVVYGARISLRVAVVVVAIAASVGAAIGMTAALCGGLIDEALMRFTDIFLAFPPLILAMAVNAGLGPGIESAMLAVAVTWWTGYARMIRGQVMTTKNNLYVDAARVIGASRGRVLICHILPNCIGPTTVEVTLDAGAVVLTVAGLSFIGLGVQPPTPEWGAMVSEGHGYILTQWWWPTFPGLALCWMVVGLNLVGDFLRDLLDPRLQKRSG